MRRTCVTFGIKPLDKANLKQWKIQGRRGHKPPYLSSQVLENTREDPRGKFRDALLGLRLGGDGERGRKLQIDNLKDLTREELDRLLYGTSNITNLRRFNLASHPYLNSVISTPEVEVNFVFLLDGEADRKNALKGIDVTPPAEVGEEIPETGMGNVSSSAAPSSSSGTLRNPTDARISKMRSLIRKAAEILKNQSEAQEAQKENATSVFSSNNEEEAKAIMETLKGPLDHARAVKHIQICTRSHTLDISLRQAEAEVDDSVPPARREGGQPGGTMNAFERSVEEACRLLLNVGDILVPETSGSDDHVGSSEKVHLADRNDRGRRRVPLVCNEQMMSKKLRHPDEEGELERFEATIGGNIDVCLWRGRTLVKNLQVLRDRHPFALKLHQQADLSDAKTTKDDPASSRTTRNKFSARNYQPKRSKWKDEASSTDDLFRWHFSVNDPRSHFSDHLGHNRTMSVIALVTQPFDGYSNMMHPFLKDRVKKLGFNPVKESDPLAIARTSNYWSVQHRKGEVFQR